MSSQSSNLGFISQGKRDWDAASKAAVIELPIADEPPRGRLSRLLTCNVRSLWSLMSMWSVLSLWAVASMLSVGSVLSVGSAGSGLSIGSVASLLSIGSFRSILSIGCDQGYMQICI